MAGLRARQERVPRLGVLTQQDANGVARRERGRRRLGGGGRRQTRATISSAVGDIVVEDQQFGAKLRAKYGASPEGSPLMIKVRRGTDTIPLAGKLQFGAGRDGGRDQSVGVGEGDENSRRNSQGHDRSVRRHPER